MANKVEHYYGAVWVDISDYVVDGVDKIPRSFMNEDLTLKTDMFSISVAETIRTDANYNDPAFKFLAGDKFRFSVNSTIFLTGIIDASLYQTREFVFNIKIQPSIFSLDKKTLDHTTLHDALATGTNWYEYNGYDHYTFPTVGVLWLAGCLLGLDGLTLDVSAVKDVVIWHAPVSGGDWDVDITYQDLIVDENQLYCVNQNVATFWGEVETLANNLTQNKITCFHLLSELLSSLGLVLRQIGESAFELIEPDQKYTIAADSQYDYQDEEFNAEKDTNTIGVSIVYPFITRDKYASNVITDITGQMAQGNVEIISSLSNLIIYYTDAKKRTNKYADAYASSLCWNVPSASKVVTDPLPAPYGMGIFMNTAQRKAMVKINNYQKETITTDYESTDKSVLEHNADLEWSNSEIVQETY